MLYLNSDCQKQLIDLDISLLCFTKDHDKKQIWVLQFNVFSKIH
jgi:hypothetical protein